MACLEFSCDYFLARRVSGTSCEVDIVIIIVIGLYNVFLLLYYVILFIYLLFYDDHNDMFSFFIFKIFNL